jgi:plasmid stabilization system protein ParE
MYKIKYSPIAEKDLLEINDYIKFELENLQAAKRIIQMIFDKISNLSQFPFSGAMLSSIIGIDTNYRFLVCKTHLVFYHFEDNTVFVDRILYGKRDYMKILFE